MFQWTDIEVTNVVRLVLQSMRKSALGLNSGCHEKLVDALAVELGAFAWQASCGHLRLKDETSNPVAVWTEHSQRNREQRQAFNPNVVYGAVIERMLNLAREGDGEPIEIITRRNDSLDESTTAYALAWLAVQPDGTCVCIEFLKTAAMGPFTTRDEALLRVLSTELHSQAKNEPQETDTLEEAHYAGLPRRQREVLSQLLMGLSVKEIANHLGISYYTVNDYVKALYRRFNVSSRGELMAAIYGRRKQTAQ